MVGKDLFGFVKQAPFFSGGTPLGATFLTVSFPKLKYIGHRIPYPVEPSGLFDSGFLVIRTEKAKRFVEFFAGFKKGGRVVSFTVALFAFRMLVRELPLKIR